jgi:hypothetical protein
MLILPAEHCALIAALSVCLTGAQAGLLMPDRHEDPDALAAALETASLPNRGAHPAGMVGPRPDDARVAPR